MLSVWKEDDLWGISPDSFPKLEVELMCGPAWSILITGVFEAGGADIPHNLRTARDKKCHCKKQQGLVHQSWHQGGPNTAYHLISTSYTCVCRKEECPKLRFRRRGCTYRYECKEECTEKKDCSTTYQYKCKEYRRQVRTTTQSDRQTDGLTWSCLFPYNSDGLSGV